MQETKATKKSTNKDWYKQWWGILLIAISVFTFTWPLWFFYFLFKAKGSIIIKILVAIFIGIPFVIIATSMSVNVVNPRSSSKIDNSKPIATQSSVVTPTPTPTRKDPGTLNISASHNNVYVTVTSNEAKDLGNCKLTLNQDYKLDLTNKLFVSAGQKAQYAFSDFTRKDGLRFNAYFIKPNYLSVWCERVNGDNGNADLFWE